MKTEYLSDLYTRVTQNPPEFHVGPSVPFNLSFVLGRHCPGIVEAIAISSRMLDKLLTQPNFVEEFVAHDPDLVAQAYVGRIRDVEVVCPERSLDPRMAELIKNGLPNVAHRTRDGWKFYDVKPEIKPVHGGRVAKPAADRLREALMETLDVLQTRGVGVVAAEMIEAVNVAWAKSFKVLLKADAEEDNNRSPRTNKDECVSTMRPRVVAALGRDHAVESAVSLLTYFQDRRGLNASDHKEIARTLTLLKAVAKSEALDQPADERRYGTVQTDPCRPNAPTESVPETSVLDKLYSEAHRRREQPLPIQILYSEDPNGWCTSDVTDVVVNQKGLEHFLSPGRSELSLTHGFVGGLLSQSPEVWTVGLVGVYQKVKTSPPVTIWTSARKDASNWPLFEKLPELCCLHTDGHWSFFKLAAGAAASE